MVIDPNPQTIFHNSRVTCGPSSCSDCQPNVSDNILYPLIDFPVDNLPFTYPAQPPPRVEYAQGGGKKPKK